MGHKKAWVGELNSFWLKNGNIKRKICTEKRLNASLKDLSKL